MPNSKLAAPVAEAVNPDEYQLLLMQGENGQTLGAVRLTDICYDPVVLVSITASRILKARERHPGMSLAEMYNEKTMPPDLREAHRLNDMAVCQAYGLPADATEQQIVAHLMQTYQNLTRKERKKPADNAGRKQ